jgi:hypothetical protein
MHFMPLKRGSQQLIAGMNVFETTMHLEQMIDQSVQALQPNGYLLAIQDVMPNEAGSLFVEYLRSGRKDVRIHVHKEDKKNKDGIHPILLETEEGLVDARSYHLRVLKEIAEKFGMKTLFCGIIESDGLYPREDLHTYQRFHSKTHEIVSDKTKNSYCNLVSKFSAKKDPTIPKGYVQERVAPNILLLQK